MPLKSLAAQLLNPVVLLLLGFAAGMPAPAHAQDAAMVALGKQLWTERFPCRNCHGGMADGVGDIPQEQGPNLRVADYLTPEIVAELDAAATLVPTEASLQVIRCARGEVGNTYIRRGRRRVELGPVGALTFVFDPVAAPSEALPLAHAVADAGSIEEGRAALAARGVQTELDYERSRAGEGP